jgi:predicted ATPase with chaperone activity
MPSCSCVALSAAITENRIQALDHNLLMLVPPGSGKSMLARRLTTILPALTLAEAVDTTRIHRGAGRTGDRTAFVTARPCRAPITPSRMWG